MKTKQQIIDKIKKIKQETELIEKGITQDIMTNLDYKPILKLVDKNKIERNLSILVNLYQRAILEWVLEE